MREHYRTLVLFNAGISVKQRNILLKRFLNLCQLFDIRGCGLSAEAH